MNNKIKTAFFLFSFLLLVMPGVLATDKGVVTKIPITTCTGSGDLYLYQGDQFQEPDTSFKVENDELLIFTKSNRVSDVKVDGNTPDVIANEVSPFHVKVYRQDVVAGSTINIDVTADSKKARGVQGYFVQDSSNPVYNVADLGLTYDGEEENIVYLKPGTYQYIFYDKYDKYNDGSDDSRALTVKVTDGNNVLVSTSTYTKPFPVGTQGVIVHEFTVNNEGYYKVEVSTDDSVWWVLFDCEPKIEDICEGADKVIYFEDDAAVTGENCHWKGQTSDSKIIDVPETKSYYVTGMVRRGDFSDYPLHCQDNEAFYSEINGQVGPVVNDDAQSCAVVFKEEYLGTFDLQAGQETFYMHTAAACPPDDSPESVHLDYLCLYDEEEVPEFGVVAAGLALVGAIAGFAIMRRKH